jgi:hypothetical protein
MRKFLISLLFVLGGCVVAAPAPTSPPMPEPSKPAQVEAPKYMAMVSGENGYILLAERPCPHTEIVAMGMSMSPVVGKNLKEGLLSIEGETYRLCWVPLDDGRVGVIDEVAGPYALPKNVFEPYDAKKLNRPKGTDV